MRQTFKSSKLRTALLLAAPLWLLSCSTPTVPSEPTAAPSSNPCKAISVPDVDQGTRAELAHELTSAPDAAVWPDQVEAYYRMRAAVMACQGAK